MYCEHDFSLFSSSLFRCFAWRSTMLRWTWTSPLGSHNLFLVTLTQNSLFFAISFNKHIIRGAQCDDTIGATQRQQQTIYDCRRCDFIFGFFNSCFYRRFSSESSSFFVVVFLQEKRSPHTIWFTLQQNCLHRWMQFVAGSWTAEAQPNSKLMFNARAAAEI